MARRFGSSRFTRGPRKAVDWGASAPQAASTNVPGSSAVLLEVFLPIAGGETVIRTRGMLGYKSDQIAASEIQLGAFGIAVVSEQAATVGITAIPHPSTDAPWGGWFYHTYLMSEFVFSSAIAFQADFMHTIVIDSKAMRKIDEDDRIVVVVENTAATGFAIANSERFLSKVH